jgi:hypothetical protein
VPSPCGTFAEPVAQAPALHIAWTALPRKVLAIVNQPFLQAKIIFAIHHFLALRIEHSMPVESAAGRSPQTR